jgi:hypothetical protein
MNWKGFCPGIYLEGVRENEEEPVRIIVASAEARTRSIPNIVNLC